MIATNAITNPTITTTNPRPARSIATNLVLPFLFRMLENFNPSREYLDQDDSQCCNSL
jgi:hypothetical protein